MALISISGYIGSGKDLVTKIIQYLDYKENINPNIDDFINIYEDDNYFSEIVSMSSWENKKWADALKEVCSILTGIPRPDFEKPEIKNSYLGEEWNYYIVGDERFNTLEGAEYFSKNFIPIELDIKPVLTHMTVRQLLQLCGTEAMRQGFHQNVWVNALMSKYKPTTVLDNDIYSLDKSSVPRGNVVYPNWVISDTRFYNELNAVKSKGGITIRINRDDNKTTSTHPSERELDNADFDYIINNKTGEIEKLVNDVKEIMVIEKFLSNQS